MICLDHRCIRAVSSEKFAVCALFDDATLIEDDDFVSFEDGVEAMRDRDYCPSLHELAGGLFKH